jgi:aspartyl protease/PDZ domain-containing protein
MPEVRNMRRCPALLILACTVLAQAQSPSPGITTEQIVSHWRAAVHAGPWRQPRTAVVTSSSTEDGIAGKVEERVTTAGDYRLASTREFDNTEAVLSRHSQQRRDWNGFVRPVQGQELARWRAAAFETQVLAFGPPPALLAASVSPSDDGKLYLLRLTPAGATPVTWHVDAHTWLPVKSVRPGDDSEITTTYADWRELDGVLTPGRGEVRETNRPDYSWERTALARKPGVSARDFVPPRPGPSDVRMDAVIPPVPFDFDSAHVIFQAALNGRPPIWWVLDTGADQEVINTPRLADYGLKTYARTITSGGGGSAEYGYASGATFTLPGVELKDQHVAVLDQTGLERALGLPLGGIFGYDFISRFVIELDYEKKLMTLHDPRTWKYSGRGLIVPVTFDNGIPFAHGVLSVPTKPAIPAFFVLDFGAAETMTLTSPFVKANDLARLAQTNANVNRPAGLEHQFFTQNNVRGRIQQLTLGPLTVSDIPINMSVNTEGAYASADFSGTIGESIYRRYHVFLDYARNRVILEPTAEAGKPFPERRTFGLSILASGGDLHVFTVMATRPGSPAEQAGFKKGDVITACDGRPAATFTLGTLRIWLGDEGSHHRLDVTRGKEALAVPIEVKLVSLDAR